MRNLMLAWLITSCLMVVAKSSIANDELVQLSANTTNWCTQTGNNANHSYS
jgi:hypothetical protein